jgi:hypothetical protein
MDADRYREYQREVVARLDALLVERYGRDGDVLDRGYRLSLVEAGYGTVGLWSGLQSALHDAGTSFQTQELNTRLDLLLRDVLLHPDDKPTGRWAQVYRDSTPTAAARAFRARYGFPLAYARRMGRLGKWVAAAQRVPRTEPGRRRAHEARRRLLAFKQVARRKSLGPRSRAALRSLGASSSGHRPRPRYPAPIPSETALLGSTL